MNAPIERAPRGATKAGLRRIAKIREGGGGKASRSVLTAAGQGGKATNRDYMAAQRAAESND